jgi:hypothetical protein
MAVIVRSMLARMLVFMGMLVRVLMLMRVSVCVGMLVSMRHPIV